MRGIPEPSVALTDARGLISAIWYQFLKLYPSLPERVPSYTVASVPDAAKVGAGSIIFVSNEVGGAVLAFSDGTAWRRVTDRNVIS